MPVSLASPLAPPLVIRGFRVRAPDGPPHTTKTACFAIVVLVTVKAFEIHVL